MLRAQLRRHLTAAGAALLLAACSSGHARQPQPPSSASSTPATPLKSASTDPAAAPALTRVVGAMSEVRSYAFTATETVGGSTTRITGRAVRPGALFYTLSTPTRTEQIVRTGATTYRRVPPGPYRRLVRQRPVVDPLRDLLAVLRGMQDVTRTVTDGGTTFAGTLDREGALAAGLVRGATGGVGVVVPVRVIADRHALVTELTAQIPLRVSGRPVTARLTTRFSGFNVQPPVRVPGS